MRPERQSIADVLGLALAEISFMMRTGIYLCSRSKLALKKQFTPFAKNKLNFF